MPRTIIHSTRAKYSMRAWRSLANRIAWSSIRQSAVRPSTGTTFPSSECGFGSKTSLPFWTRRWGN